MNPAPHLDSDSYPTEEPTSHESRSSFLYRPLDHTNHSLRLIRILPELSPEGYLRCEIWHTTITSQYQCLSYRWGALTDLKTVLIRDKDATQPTEQPCQVGQNLHAFLHAARANPGLADTFWIDALCIDQENVPERNNQVMLMGDIYSQASRVIVWLGNYSKVVRYGAKDEDYKAFWKELDRYEYWQRAWITQEFVLPRHIDFLINDTVVPYSDIHVAYSFLQPRIRTLSNMRTLYEKQRTSRWHESRWGGISLSDDFFLLGTRHVVSTVSRDRIYSLLALLREGKMIKVDYATLTSEVVYELLKLYRGCLGLWDVLRFISLVRDHDHIYDDLSKTCGPHVEFRVYYTGGASRATGWDTEAEIMVVERLLGAKGLGEATAIRGMGFTRTRKNRQSLMLDVKVTLALLSVLLEDLDAWSMPYFPVTPHPNFDAELEIWVKNETSLFHYLYTRVFGNHTSRTCSTWAAIRVGWEPTPNGKSVPHNLIVMGLSLGWGN
jgi:hypothetical protein